VRPEGRALSAVDFYLQKARAYIERSKAAEDPRERSYLLELASDFLRMAEEADAHSVPSG